MKKLTEVQKEKIRVMIFTDNVIHKDKVNDTDSFHSDLGMDSIDIISLIIDVEKEFKININDTDVDGMLTINDLFNVIETKK